MTSKKLANQVQREIYLVRKIRILVDNSVIWPEQPIRYSWLKPALDVHPMS